MMTAGMSRGVLGPRLPLGGCILREAGEGVELREKCDDRPPLAEASDESGGHARDAALNLEPRARELRLQKLGASLLLKAHLRELPDLPRDLGKIRRSLVEKPRDVR